MDARTFFNHPDTTYIFGDLLNDHDWVLLRAALGEDLPRDRLIEAALHYGSHDLLDECLLSDSTEDEYHAYAHYCVRSQSHYTWFTIVCDDTVIYTALSANCDIILDIADDMLETVLADHSRAILAAIQNHDTPWGKIPRGKAVRLIDYAIANNSDIGGFIPWVDLRESHFAMVPSTRGCRIESYIGCVDYACLRPHIARWVTANWFQPLTAVKIYDIAGRDETIQLLMQNYVRAGHSHYIVGCITESPDPLDILERVRRIFPAIARKYLWDIAARWPISKPSCRDISMVFAGYNSIPEPATAFVWDSVITAVHTRELAHSLFPAKLHTRVAARLAQKPSLLAWMVEKGYTWDGHSRELAEYESLPAVKTLAQYYYVGELEPKARTLAAEWSSQHHSVVGYLELGFKLTRRWAAAVVSSGQREEVAYLLGLLADERLRVELFP